MGFQQSRISIGWMKQDDGSHLCNKCGHKALFEMYFSHRNGREESREVLSDFCPYCGSRMNILEPTPDIGVTAKFV